MDEEALEYVKTGKITLHQADRDEVVEHLTQCSLQADIIV